MANVYAVKSGNWSDTTLWNTSALPTTLDDVYANSFTVTVDINAQVLSIRNTAAAPIVAGGGFRLNNAISLSANVIGGTGTCFSFLSSSPNYCTLYGSVTGSASSGSFAIFHSSTGTINIIGNTIESNIVAAGGSPIFNTTTGTINIQANVIARGNTAISNSSTGTISITGNIFGSQTTVNIPGISNNGTCIVYGNVAGGPELAGGAGGNSYGINNAASTSVLTVYGNVSGAGAVTGTGYGVFNSSTGTINIIGNSVGRVSAGSINNSTGTINMTGNCIGSSTNSVPGAINNSFGTFNVRGLAIGGSGSTTYGINNNSGGIVSLVGNVIGGTGSTAYGANNAATGYLEIQGSAIGNEFGLNGPAIQSVPGVNGSQTGTTIIRGLSCGIRGQWPTAGNIRIIPQSTSTVTLYTSALSAGPSTVLFTSLSTNIVPPASSVRLGTRYNLNESIGTCSIPSISSVLQGVSVDNSIGIAALQPQTIWNYSVLSATDVNSLGGRLANVATVQSIGQQLTALN